MLKVSDLTPEERRLYEDCEIYKKNMQKLMSREAYVFEQGFERGVKAIELAHKLLNMEFSEETISEGADLDLATLQ